MLTTLTLTQFRTYQKRAFTFAPDTTLILGPNTAGKTNILEAIMLLATGKSFRAKRETEMLRWEQEVGMVAASVTEAGDSTRLEIRLTRGSVGGVRASVKRYLVNGIARRQVDFAGKLRAVLFWPEDLELIIDSPSIRRAYLDTVLTQTDREYRRNLQSYERGLRQRNRLLDAIHEGNASSSQLLFWNQLLIKAGGYITDARQSLIDTINKVSINDVHYRADYDKSVISESRLASYSREEVAARTTLVGPHRDDFVVYEVPESGTPVDLARYGSRGQQRLAVLWLKFSELAYIEETTGTRPVLLLDDVFSELDAAHRRLVMGLVTRQQTIVTAADEDIVREFAGVRHEIIRL